MAAFWKERVLSKTLLFEIKLFPSYSVCKHIVLIDNMYLISRQETDSSALLDKRSKQHPNTKFDLHSPKALHRCTGNQHGHVLCLLSMEACL